MDIIQHVVDKNVTMADNGVINMSSGMNTSRDKKLFGLIGNTQLFRGEFLL